MVGAITENAWNMLAVTYDDTSGNCYIYVNGRLVGSSLANDENMVSSSNNWYIGEDVRDGSGLPLAGAVRDAAIYNRVLSPAEIASLYVNPHQLLQEPGRLVLVGGEEEEEPSGTLPDEVGRLVNGGLVNNALVYGRLIA